MLAEEIIKLVSLKQEGPYWDFKKQWYTDDKIQDMLIDIICMANNLENRDAYIIIGIDEENDYNIVDVVNDPNRKNTQQLTDFIKARKFAGEYRPVVTVEHLQYTTAILDVIVIHNTLNTPYFLKEEYRGVHPNNIYVRSQDSNTARDKSADYHQIEYLWKKRFGMLLSPIEKVKLYLKSPEQWADSPSQEGRKYYTLAPEYTIDYSFEPSDGRDGYEFYLFNQTDETPHWSDITIRFHQTVLVDIGGVFLDGGRYFTSTPDFSGFSLNDYSSWDVSYCYYVMDSIKHLIHEFYYSGDGEQTYARDRFEECILIFVTETERKDFIKFAKANWHRKDELSKGIIPICINPIKGYNVEVFVERYINSQVMKKLLEEYRYQMRRNMSQ